MHCRMFILPAGLVVFAAGTSVSASSTQPIPGTKSLDYLLDSRESRMEMRTATEGVMSGFAPGYTFVFYAFEGFIRLTPGSITPAEFVMVTKADSIRVVGRTRESEKAMVEGILKNEMMETARYPEIVYRGSNIALEKTGPATYRATIDGTMSQHGVTRRCPIVVDVVVTDTNVRMRGSFTILQSDYGMRPKRLAGGLVRVKDRVFLSFDLVATRAH